MKSALRWYAVLNYLAAVESIAFAFLAFLAFFAFLVVGAAAAGAAGVAAAAGVAGAAGAAVCAAAKAERENRPATRAAISFFIFNPSIRQFGLIFSDSFESLPVTAKKRRG